MKKNLFVCVASAVIVFLALSGCDLAGKNTYTFKNGSDHGVTVTPDGQESWEEFTLLSGHHTEVVIPDDQILFTYSPADTVGLTEEEEGAFTFINQYAFEFVNDSDYDITVSPDEQDSWIEFVLAAGESTAVGIPESTIYYLYNYADWINVDSSQAGVVRFYNKTILAIQNLSSVDIELVEWNGLYFGLDLIWNSYFGEYSYGIKAGNGYYREVAAGTDYISFWFPTGGTGYRTVSYVTVSAEDQIVFTFYDSTTIMARSINGITNGPSERIDDALPIPGTSRAAASAEAETSSSASISGKPEK